MVFTTNDADGKVRHRVPRTLLVDGVLVAAVAFASFSNSIDGPWVFDDHVAIKGNPGTARAR
jgi:hypothetical protein